MPNPSQTSLQLLIALSLFLAGCASAPSEETTIQHLPFHVAVIPISVDDSIGIDAVSGTGEELDEQLQFSRAAITEALIEALGQRFVEVTRLEYTCHKFPDDYVRQAKEIGADLILRGELRYAPDVKTELNSWFKYNVPLYLIGGPASWFVPDRDYNLECGLEVSIYDVTVLDRSTDYGDAKLTNSIALLAKDKSSLENTALNFKTRGLDKPKSFLSSLFVPAGLLSKDEGVVRDRLGPRVLEEVCTDITNRIAGAPERLLRPSQFDFWPVFPQKDPETLVVRLKRDEVAGMSRFQFDDGVAIEFDEAQVTEAAALIQDARVVEYHLTVPEHFERVTLIDASARQNRRTFTLRSGASVSADDQEEPGETAREDVTPR